MTDYRAVVRHVRYWRGAIHKWSTVYPLTGVLSSGDYAACMGALYDMEQACLFAGNGTTAGGIYEIALYASASGGVPVYSNVYFPEAVPASWIPYAQTAWTTTGVPCVDAAEVALQVEWAAGLSSSGKPVFFRKWYHAVAQRAVTPGASDISSSDQTSLTAGFVAGFAAIDGYGVQLGNSVRLAGTTPTVGLFYGNHQMPRGRRKPLGSLTHGSVLPPGLFIVPGSDGSLDAA